MRKNTKLAVILTAAALLAAGSAFCTFAKGWVKEAEGLYYYEDSYGNREYMTWEKDTNADGTVNYYYLGEDGYMVTNTLVETDGNYYWCGADGAKVTSQWVKVPADEVDQEELGVDYRWYWFDSNGKAAKANTVKKQIGDKYYFFDENGKMLFGYVDAAAHQMTTDNSVALTAGSSYTYYCGSNEDGYVRKSEWVKETLDGSSTAYDDSDSYWTWYQSSGVRATASETGYLAGGVRYYFTSEGFMKTGWNTTSISDGKATISVAQYFGGSDDGKPVKKGWVYTTPETTTGADYIDGTRRWFWFDNTGAAIYKAGVYKINGKFYAFKAPEDDDNASKMLSGMVALTFGEKADSILDAADAVKVSTSAVKLADWLANADGKYSNIYYFSGDEANDGSLKKSVTFSQEFLDDTYTLNVDKTGKLTDGYNSSAKRYYRNGYLLKASDELRYEIVKTYGYNDKNYALLSAAGTEVTKGYVADSDGNYYVVKDGIIYIADSSLVAPAQAASAVNNGKTTITYDSVTYKVETVKSEIDGSIYIIKLVKQ